MYKSLNVLLRPYYVEYNMCGVNVYLLFLDVYYYGMQKKNLFSTNNFQIFYSKNY